MLLLHTVDLWPQILSMKDAGIWLVRPCVTSKVSEIAKAQTNYYNVL